MTDVPEKPKTAEVCQIAPSAVSARYSHISINQLSEGNPDWKPPAIELGNGLVAHIEVPPTWEITNYKKGAHRTIEALMPRDPNTNEPFNDQPILEIRFRGIPVGRENVPKFKEIMEADLHTLNHNDMNWVERMLNRQTVEVLHLSLARTCEVHGRRVLELSGHYDIYPYKKLPCMLWYIDVDFSYSYLQKFIYHGCVEDDNFKQCEENFLKHKGEAAQIFKSIEWSSWAPPPPLK